MNHLLSLLTGSEIAQAILALSLVIAGGLCIGSIRIGGVQIGIAGVLFSGILCSRAGLHPPVLILEFVREFGLVLFVYSIGMQLGPGFFNALKKDGLRLNIIACCVAVGGLLITALLIRFAGVPKSAAIGLLAGATTNTPSLAAGEEALKGLGAAAETVRLAGIGYAIAYPFGIIGIILTMLLIRSGFRINPKAEADRFTAESEPQRAGLEVQNIRVTHPKLHNLALRDIPFLADASVVISRILHQDKVRVARPDSVIQTGDILLAVGPKEKIDGFRLLAGESADCDIRELPQHLTTRRIVVTHKEILGKSITELPFLEQHGVTLTRIIRSEVHLAVTPSMKLQYGDVVIAVGDADAVMAAAGELGNAPAELNHPQLIPIFVGIFLGVALGSVPFAIPGIPSPIKLGIAGGPLLVALILSRIGHWGPLVWYLPSGANFMIRELGITLFLAAVGLKSGEPFFAAFSNGQGWAWMGLAALITLIPLLIAGIAARILYRMNYLTLAGLLAGSMTDPPALAFTRQLAASNAPALAYATVYPLVMILRILLAQIAALIL